MVEILEVQNNHKFNYENLIKFLKENISKDQDKNQINENFDIKQFIHGQSNPTFLVTYNSEKFVLRKKPQGTLLRGAHLIEREYQILSELHKVKYPVPEPIIYCKDTSVIGTEFYLMKFVDGRIFRNPRLPTLSPQERFEVYSEYIKVMARLHSFDPKQLNLISLTKTDVPYHVKQIEIWTQQYRSSETQKIKEMEFLIDWLSKNHPKQSDDSFKGIVHGDFRLDNIIFDKNSFKILAVLDWELTTLGDPIADVAYACQFYHIPLYFKIGLGNFDKGFYGIPHEIEFKQIYTNCLGRNPPSTKDWIFYVTLSIFRLCGIMQGVYKRSLLGNASSPYGGEFLKHTIILAKVGAQLTSKSLYSDFEQRIAVLKENSIFKFLGKEKFSDYFFETYLKVLDFMEEHIYPNEKVFLQSTEVLEGKERWRKNPEILKELKSKAKKFGLFNLFLPEISKLSNLEYAVICETLGRSFFLAPEVFNCSAPDTGNMEVLYRYGSEEQKKKYLYPLLEGEIRSCFGMTEKGVASSDATNINTTIIFSKEKQCYVVNGRKWWGSGLGDPRCKFSIVMGITPNKKKSPYQQHTMVLVPVDTKGVKVVRPLKVFGYDDAPHGHMDATYDNVEVPRESIILGEGRGFEIAQGRLGPGRIHHCMRLIGMAERAFDNMVDRVGERKVFGKQLNQNDNVVQIIAKCRIEIEQARFLVLAAADKIDREGNKNAKDEIAMIKVVAPKMAMKVIDRAIQIFGGEGLSQDTYLAFAWISARSLMIADGPDEVHLASIGKSEIFSLRTKF